MRAAEDMVAGADLEMRELAADEVRELRERLAAEDLELTRLLIPKDPRDDCQHLPRNPRRHRRRRSGDLRGRPVPHVFPLRRAARLEGRSAVRKRGRARRLPRDHQPDRGPGRVFAAQVRIRRAPRAACAGNRSAGPHPHVRLHRRHPAGTRRDRGPADQSGRSAHRHVPRVGRGRPARQQDRLRDPHHAHADGRGGRMPGRTLAAQEPFARHVAAAGAAARGRSDRSRRRSRRRSASCRWARATARSASAPTTSRRDA